MNFGLRAQTLIRDRGALCVGIDPHASTLDSWGLPDTAQGVREFALRVVDELGASVPAMKPNSAFFERHGSAGIRVLEEVLIEIRQRDVLAVLDVKRGDIGSTMAGYADAYLPVGAPLEADAITISPFLGPESLNATVDLAQEHGKGVFVLALTSNPDGKAIQLAQRDGRSVTGIVCDWAYDRNTATTASTGSAVGDVGLVVGATVAESFGDLIAPRTMADLGSVYLIPGLGAQGGTAEDIQRDFGTVNDRILASASRAIVKDGPESVRQIAEKFVSFLREGGY